MELRYIKKKTEKQLSTVRAGVETLVVTGVGVRDGVVDCYALMLDRDASINGGGVGRAARDVCQKARQEIIAEAMWNTATVVSRSKLLSKGILLYYSLIRYNKLPDSAQFRDVLF